MSMERHFAMWLAADLLARYAYMPPEALSVTLPTLDDTTAMMGRLHAPGLPCPLGVGLARRGPKAWTTRRGPTAFTLYTSIISCCLTSDQSWSGSSSALCRTPALWITCVMPDLTFPLMALAASWTDCTSPTSHWMSVTCLLAALRRPSVGSLRYVAMTWHPLAAICFTSSRPIPRDAPTMRTSESFVRGVRGFCSSASILSSKDREAAARNTFRAPEWGIAGWRGVEREMGRSLGATPMGEATNERAGRTVAMKMHIATHRAMVAPDAM
mmetsp:Transcript_9903/g.23132  ORF Transcript_9903/g.23132 Transcript_9903/m.23132 type:complete len:270 (-) Transcript_9903:191-1000(-)